MNCKNCGHEIYNIYKDGKEEKGYNNFVHKEHEKERMYKCLCGCVNPEPEKKEPTVCNRKAVAGEKIEPEKEVLK